MSSARALAVHSTPIPGLLVVDLPQPGDARGWFKENWQRAKMTALGLPDFGPVQHSVAWNPTRGVTRGFHAEPWDKFVSLATGRVFGAWVDLRDGDSFGATFSLEFGTDQAVFVPRGVGNSYQTLTDDVAYSYLLNDHWSPEAVSRYTYLNLADETVAVDWPIPLDETVRSEADLHHPRLAEVVPMAGRRTVVLGSGGQLGQALLELLPDAVGIDRDEVDLGDPAAVCALDWTDVEVVINAAAFTAVDLAETTEGRRQAWAVNSSLVSTLVGLARQHRFTLVQISTDYVFDGAAAEHDEDEPLSPLGVYAQTKAAADLVVQTTPSHYLVRTSWVIGAGRNFVATMADLAARGVSPAVVNDQFGRLTFADDLAAGIVHLVRSGAEFGCYNLTNAGPVMSWAQIAARVFELCGATGAVTEISTEKWVADQVAAGKVVAARPRHSALALDKIAAAGFVPPDADQRLVAYLERTATAQ